MRKPGIDSSLSSVPPVCPRPRPDILPKMAPQAATSGASTSVTLSPTPPLECLSSTGRRSTLRSSSLPLSTRARASATCLGVAHAAQDHRHEQGAGLVGRYGAAYDTVDERAHPHSSSSLPSRFQAMTSCTKSTLSSLGVRPGPGQRASTVRAETGGEQPGKAAADGEHVFVRTYRGRPVDHQRQQQHQPRRGAARTSGAADMPTTSPCRASQATSAGVSNWGRRRPRRRRRRSRAFADAPRPPPALAAAQRQRGSGRRRRRSLQIDDGRSDDPPTATRRAQGPARSWSARARDAAAARRVPAARARRRHQPS